MIEKGTDSTSAFLDHAPRDSSVEKPLLALPCTYECLCLPLWVCKYSGAPHNVLWSLFWQRLCQWCVYCPASMKRGVEDVRGLREASYHSGCSHKQSLYNEYHCTHVQHALVPWGGEGYLFDVDMLTHKHPHIPYPSAMSYSRACARTRTHAHTNTYYTDTHAHVHTHVYLFTVCNLSQRRLWMLPLTPQFHQASW